MRSLLLDCCLIAFAGPLVLTAVVRFLSFTIDFLIQLLAATYLGG